MRLVPDRPLVLATLLPLALAIAALAERALVVPMLVVDAAIVLVALVDAAVVRGQRYAVERVVPDLWSLARPMGLELQLARTAGGGRRAIEVHDDLFPAAKAELPLRATLDARGRAQLSYKVTSTARGVHALGDVWVRCRSPLGLWVHQLRLPAPAEVRVYPDLAAIRDYELLAKKNRDVFASRLTRLRGGDTEFERLRDYAPDDEMRRVDWKATARRRKLTVREYQLEQNQSIVFMLDCGRLMTSVWDDLTGLDYALNATLMMAHVAVRRGDLVGLLAFDEVVRRLIAPRPGVRASNQLIQATFDLFPQMVESDYEAAFRQLRRQMKRRSLVVLVTHAIDDPTARRVAALARELMPAHLPLVALLKDAEVERLLARRPDDADGACVQAAASEVALWRDQHLRELERSGVMVLDVFHHELTGALVAKYLEVKARGLI
jgi:uncharacterized protein (DUF58 family)